MEKKPAPPCLENRSFQTLGLEPLGSSMDHSLSWTISQDKSETDGCLQIFSLAEVLEQYRSSPRSPFW